VLVGVVERAGRLPRDLERVLDGKLALPPEPVAETLALDERHREPEPAAGFAGVEDRENVRMLEPGGEADLALEPVGTERGGQRGMEHLERHRAVVLEVLREEDRGHAPAPELALEGVAGAQAFLKLRAQVGHARPGWGT